MFYLMIKLNLVLILILILIFLQTLFLSFFFFFWNCWKNWRLLVDQLENIYITKNKKTKMVSKNVLSIFGPLIMLKITNIFYLNFN